MRYHTIGSTGLRVSEISFGAGSSAGLMTNGSPQEQQKAVQLALDAGINHFDTAAFYGYGTSEVYLGQALRAASAKDVLVTTKFAIAREFRETRELRRAVRQSVEQSLFRMRRDTIDVLLMHNALHRTHAPYDPKRESERVATVMNTYLPPITFDDLLGDGGIYEEVQQLLSEGKVRCFGLSGQDNDPTVVKALIASGSISIFNQTFNLLNPSAGFSTARSGRRITGSFAERQEELFIEFENVIEAAHRAQVAVSVVSPMAAGVLTEAADRGEAPPDVVRRTNRFPFPGEFERQIELARRFNPIAQAAGMTVTELAIRFVLSAPGVTTLVAGISSPSQLEELVRYADTPPLTEEVLAALRAVWFRD